MTTEITRWGQVIGSKNQIKVILNAIKRGVLPHFVLYTGASGIGKSTIAKLTAKSLLCLNPDKETGEPCYECSSCLALDNNEHTSFKKINMPEMCRKEDINEQIKDIFQFKKLSSRTVYVLEEIHDLKPELQRPLLEPLTSIPDDVFIISCTTMQYKLIPELVSRALRLELRNPTPKECFNYVVSVAYKFGIALPSETAIERYAELCDYNPRLIADTLKVVATDDTLTEESLSAMFNTVKNKDTIEFLTAFAKSESVVELVKMNSLLEELSLSRLINKSIDILFNAILYKNTLKVPEIRNDALKDFITQDLNALSVNQLAQAMSVLGGMDIKDRDSYSKNMSKILDGKLKLLNVANKSLAGISNSTTVEKPAKKEVYTAPPEKTKPNDSTTTSEFNKPIQNSAQVESLLLGMK